MTAWNDQKIVNLRIRPYELFLSLKVGKYHVASELYIIRAGRKCAYETWLLKLDTPT